MAPAVAESNGQVVGFIDIGTYSARLLLVRLNPNKSYSVLSELKEPARLGVGEFQDQRLDPEAMQRTATICAMFAQMARRFKADPLIAVATAATREARNKRQFLRLVKKEADLDVRVVSGREEARLIYLGVSRGAHLNDQNALFIDIGGGSTEVIVGDERQYQYLSSLKLGSIRLSQQFKLDQPTDPISPHRYAQVCRHVRDVAVRAIQSLRKLDFQMSVGSSGTIINLAEIAAKMFHDSSAEQDLALTYDDLCKVSKLLCSLPLEERRKVPGINPNRAEIILGGAAIIETLMQQLQIEKIHISRRGLRDGLLVDHIERGSSDTVGKEMSTRQRSVLLLGRRCGFDESHAGHVARLALDLFDSAALAGLHQFSPSDRELLRYAALLHDIGLFLSFDNHHVHTYYLIKHADLEGFDQTEVSIMAALARYHRKGTPRKSHPGFAELDRAQRKLVTQLSALLRIAETLDRSHSGVVQSAKLSIIDQDAVALEVVADGDCALEVCGVPKHFKAFRKAFGRTLIFDVDTEFDGQADPRPDVVKEKT